MGSGDAGAGFAVNGGRNSIVGAGLRVVGDLQSDGDIRIDGTVEGQIASRSVTISEGAHVDGRITAESVHIAGSVKGQIEAISVTLAMTARVVGTVTHNTLSLEDGAVIDGLRPWRPSIGLIRTRVPTQT